MLKLVSVAVALVLVDLVRRTVAVMKIVTEGETVVRIYSRLAHEVKILTQFSVLYNN